MSPKTTKTVVGGRAKSVCGLGFIEKFYCKERPDLFKMMKKHAKKQENAFATYSPADFECMFANSIVFVARRHDYNICGVAIATQQQDQVDLEIITAKKGAFYHGTSARLVEEIEEFAGSNNIQRVVYTPDEEDDAEMFETFGYEWDENSGRYFKNLIELNGGSRKLKKTTVKKTGKS
jgi:hypothetical protein